MPIPLTFLRIRVPAEEAAVPHGFQPGDPVIYMRSKQSSRPGPRARLVSPTGTGDSYNYVVDKYWRVQQILDDGDLLLVTRRGKLHRISASDPMLRKPGLILRLLMAARFPVQTMPGTPPETGQ